MKITERRLPSVRRASGSIFAAAALLALATSAHAEILPADRATAWNPGIPGGVPFRTTVCATVNAATYGNGSADASAGIQAAINACTAGQVLQLSAGTFKINDDYLLLDKGITLRGAGTGSTILLRTNGAQDGTYVPIVPDPVIVIGPNRWPRPDDATSQNLTQDGAKGALSVTVANASGLAAGQIVLLDEDNYNTASWKGLPNRNGAPTSVKIWATDRAVWMRHNPSAAEDDPFPAATTWFMRAGRPISELKEVASVSGNVVTFTTPLHISYRTAKLAQLTRFTGQNVHVKNAGLENLTVHGGGDGNVRFQGAAHSWMKNVESTKWLGEGVGVAHSFRVEVRDSYIHHAVWPNPGGGGYAIMLAHGAAEILIENNIVLHANKMIVAEACGAGSVVGYNYMDDGQIAYDPSWVEVGLNGSHMVGSHHMLFEGNESFNYDSDNTHGNAIYHTVFRNYLSGKRRSFTGMSNARAGGLMYGSWWHSFLGNVMGQPGASGWAYEDPGTPWGSSYYIWKLGYDPTRWEQEADPEVLSTVIRHGNFDYVTNSVVWNPSNPDHNLPASLYLTSKPAFFGSNPWPWVDPTGSTKLHTLPAKARFLGGPTNTVSVAFAAGSASVPEAVGSSSAAVVLTTSSGAPTTAAVSVPYTAGGGTATAGSDYTLAGGTLSFPSGTPSGASQSINFTIANDGSSEPSETFTITLGSPTGANLGNPAARTITIVDDDGTALNVGTTTVATNASNTASVTGGPANPRDWVGLFATTSTDTQILAWQYLNGSRTPPATGIAAATLSFAMPATPGGYHFRLFADDGYQRLATSPTVTVQTSGAALAATPASPFAGSTAAVAVTGGPANARDWVGLFATGAGDHQILEWQYLNGAHIPPANGVASANLVFQVPQTLGSFEFRFFGNDSYTRLATSNVINVQGTSTTLTASPGSVSGGAAVTVGVSGGPGNARDWVGLYVTTASDLQLLDWKYLNGSRTPPPNGLAAATLAFAMPQSPANYQFRLFRNDSYARIATSNTVAVQGSAATIAAAPGSVAAGGTVAVTVAGGPANAVDWVGLFAVNGTDVQVLDWKYLNGARTPPATGQPGATLGFVMPAASGSYNFRFFKNNSYDRLATSNPVSVQ